MKNHIYHIIFLYFLPEWLLKYLYSQKTIKETYKRYFSMYHFGIITHSNLYGDLYNQGLQINSIHTKYIGPFCLAISLFSFVTEEQHIDVRNYSWCKNFHFIIGSIWLSFLILDALLLIMQSRIRQYRMLLSSKFTISFVHRL